MKKFTFFNKLFFTLLALLLLIGGYNVDAWGQVTVSGTITDTKKISGTSYYVVMKYTGGEKGTSYRILEGISRSDVISRSNSAPADKLYIELKYSKLISTFASQKAKVQVSADNSSWSDATTDISLTNGYNWYGLYSLPANDVKYLRLISTDGLYDKYFRDVYMTMASYCKFENANELDFGNNTYLVPKDLTKKILWSNITNKDIEIKGTDKDRFSVSLTKVGCSAGKWGYTVVTVTYKSDQYTGSQHTATLEVNGQSITLKGTTIPATPRITTDPTASEITYNTAISNSTITAGVAKHPTLDQTVDGTWTWQTGTQLADAYNTYVVVFTPDSKYNGAYTAQTCTISVPVTKLDQELSWNLAEKDERDEWMEYATGTPMGAISYKKATTTATGLPITYTSSDNSIATVDASGNLVVHTIGQLVTITASQGGNGNWNAAENVTKTFKTCGAKPNNFTDVTATNLTYGQTLAQSTLGGNVKLGAVVVSGTLEWENPAILPNATQNNTPESFSVVFTPSDPETYGSAIFTVPVTVAKADPVFAWRIGTQLRASSQYSNFFTTNNSAGTLHVSTSNNTLLSVTDKKLTTGDVSSATNGWIKVRQDATDNFNALSEQTINVTVNPKSEVCLPVTSMNADKLQDMTMDTEGDVSWCNTKDPGTQYLALYEVVYKQRVGIQLGSWTAGLDGLISEGTYSNKSVTLAFNGSPKNISFEAESQTLYTVKLVLPHIGRTIQYPATGKHWTVAESADGVNFTTVYDNTFGTADISEPVSAPLDATTRYVKITYSGNFAGFVKNLQITKRDPYLNVEPTSLTFGTNEHPLQDPQKVKIDYGALGSCGQTGAVTATITGTGASSFYLDKSNFTDNVGFDYNGQDSVYVRCNEVGKTATLTFTAFNGTSRSVTLTSATPELTSAGSTIFKTGTEHAPEAGTAYRTETTLDYTKAFTGAQARYDTLYIYGVTESGATNRLWEMDVVKGYKVPAINVAEGNLYTPCFVYAKNGTKYTYARTCNANQLLNISAAGKKLGFIGYRPASMAATANAIQLNGAAGNSTELYLDNTEIVANGVVLKTNSSGDAEPFVVKLYPMGNNIFTANAAAVQMSAGKTRLTIEQGAEVSSIVLTPAAGCPSIDLAGANNVTINGSNVELHNATRMAIVHMNGATELTDGSVNINDGTIVGETTLGMPQNTLIDGGTFNTGNVVCYNSRGKVVRPFNSRNEMLGRRTMTKEDLAANYDWYGQSYLILDGASKVNPMLFGGEGVCVFNGTQDEQSNKPINWTSNPSSTSDAIVAANMEVNDTLSVKSLTINEGVTVTVKDGATLTIGDGDSFRETAGNLHVENGANVNLSTGQLNVNNFVLDANLGRTDENVTIPSASGQVKNEDMLNVSGDAYFRLALDPSGRVTLGWYDFVVPFEVNVIGGISVAEYPDAEMKFNVNYSVMAYDEAKHAQRGKHWNKFNGTMQPGRAYTIALDDEIPWNTVVFKKKAGAALTGDRSFTSEFSGMGASNQDNGWNGFGNATLHHTELDVPAGTLIQLYDHAHKCFQPRLAKDYSIAVGLSFFMQFAGVETVTLLPAEGNAEFRAPKRAMNDVESFRLALKAEDAVNPADYIWVSASEEATGEYVIGRDVVKMGTMSESTVARMWTMRNGINLCSNEMPMTDNIAECELGLYAPQARTYTLAVEEAPQDANLYLTYNGQVIWDLTAGAYTVELGKGTFSGYGLRIGKRAPQITTGIDNTTINSKAARKVLVNNTLYIVTPEGEMYDVVGKNIK